MSSLVLFFFILPTKSEKSGKNKIYPVYDLTVGQTPTKQGQMTTKKLSIELSEETYSWLKQVAEENHRSVSGQVRFFLDIECQTNPDNSPVATEEKGAA